MWWWSGTKGAATQIRKHTHTHAETHIDYKMSRKDQHPDGLLEFQTINCLHLLMLMLCQTWFCTPWAWMGDKLELIQPPISATNSITTGICEDKMSPRTIRNTPQRLKVAQAKVDLKWQQSIDSKWWFLYALMIMCRWLSDNLFE